MNSVIQYQGRKARRAGSEQRRRAILEAALRIIIRDGVRSVRHRAVAKEADVPLSATTYYFKDITDLITDTFTLFAEQAMSDVIGPFRDQAFGLIGQLDVNGVDADKKAAVLAALADATADYILRQVREQRDHLIAEQAFFMEAVLDERLRKLAENYKAEQLKVLRQACERIGAGQPQEAAELIYADLSGIELDLLVAPQHLGDADVRERIRYLFRVVMS